MLLWFAGVSFVIVWAVFRDTAIDYRFVMLGALVPDGIDAVAGGDARVAHSVLASVTVLVVVMLATRGRGRRTLRRRILALPIGMFCHLVLDGMWTRTDVFWWPFFGDVAGKGIPSFSRPLAVVAVQEAAGLLALWWVVRRFRLSEPERRRQFVRTGRLGRDLRVLEA